MAANPPSSPTPCMNQNERALYASLIHRGTRCLEFGSGGSTRWVLQIGKTPIKLVSVETDRGLVKKLSTDPNLEQALSDGKLKLIYADIGETGAWGFPRETTPKEKLLNYTLNLWPVLERDFNLVCIDGRFRLATSLLALLYLPEATFVFHNFFGRDYYYDLLFYIDILNYADTLIVYKRKEGIELSRMMSAIFDHIFDPR